MLNSIMKKYKFSICDGAQCLQIKFIRFFLLYRWKSDVACIKSEYKVLYVKYKYKAYIKNVCKLFGSRLCRSEFSESESVNVVIYCTEFVNEILYSLTMESWIALSIQFDWNVTVL